MKTRIVFAALVFCFFSSTLAMAVDPKEWTFLVFLNANNNLDSYSTLNMKEMEKVGSSKDVNVVVQWASLSSKTTKRILVQKSSDPANVTSPILQDLGPVDMGDWTKLVEFANWGIKNYPAKKYFLTVWDHGSGWHSIQIQNGRVHLNDDFHVSDISYDDNTGHAITTKQLGDAVREIARTSGKKIDIYGSDACLMAMAEIAGEMKDTVNVFVGSQESEPDEGWPYDALLQALVNKPSMDARELATQLTNTYVDSFQNGSHGNAEVTFSAIDLRLYPAFVQAMHNFSTEFSSSAYPNRTSLLAIAGATQAFELDDYKDLPHFVSLLAKSDTKMVAPQTLLALQQQLQELIVANRITASYKDARGLSFWLPMDSSNYNNFKDAYGLLDFARSSGWSRSLSELLR